MELEAVRAEAIERTPERKHLNAPQVNWRLHHCGRR